MLRFIIPICSALVLSAPLAHAQGNFDPEGKYELIQPPQPTSTPGKIEVVEVFSYACPHCYNFLPIIEGYEKSKAEYVELLRMPAIFRKSWENLARAYYTAKLLGVEHDIHRPLFENIHKQKQRTESTQALRAFFMERGVDGEAFDKTFDSFAVESMLRKSKVMQGRYGVTGTPMVVINGKYRTSGNLAGSYENVARVIAALAEREKNAGMSKADTPSQAVVSSGNAESLPQSDQAPG